MKVLLCSACMIMLLSAWDCVDLYSYHNSKEVFIGRVVKMELVEKEPEAIITFSVFKIYKTDSTQQLDTIHHVEILSRTCCAGFTWQLGEVYMVFTEKTENGFRIVNMCTATTIMKGFEYGTDGSWIGTPSIDEVKDWWNCMARWKKERG